jgi:hypothetical protein
MSYVQVPVQQTEEVVKNDASVDSFGRKRTSAPFTIFDSKQLSDPTIFWDDQEVSGSGTTSSHNVNKASTTLSVSSTTAGKRIRQTFQSMNYQPGKSQLIKMTSTLTNESGIIAGLGYGDDNNGIFLTNEDGINYIILRNNATGTPVETKVPQASWNNDTISNLDVTKANILVIDFEWLAVGQVRVGFDLGGIVYAHIFDNANQNDNVYMSSPNLVLRYWIENDGTGSAASMQAICSSVSSEGGQEDNGLTYRVSNGTTVVTATTGGTSYALLGIQQNIAVPGVVLRPLVTQVLITSNGDFEWELLLNPTVAGTFNYSQVADANFDLAVGVTANTVTGGIPVDGGYGTSSGTGGSASGTTGGILAASRWLGRAIDGTLDTLVLIVKSFGGGDTFTGSINVRELS